jgi:hypothetical protein
MLHVGVSLELRRLMVEDRNSNVRAGRRGRSAETPRGSRVDVDTASDRPFERASPRREPRVVAPTDTPQDRWWAWRVVDPDAEYLRLWAA